MTRSAFSLGRAPIGKCFIICDNFIDITIYCSDFLIKTIAYECDSKRLYIDGLPKDIIDMHANNGKLRVL